MTFTSHIRGNCSEIQNITNIYEFNLVSIVYFGHWPDNHYCTNSLSSLHFSSHHCTFCASLHYKTSSVASYFFFRSLNRTVWYSSSGSLGFSSCCNSSNFRIGLSFYHSIGYFVCVCVSIDFERACNCYLI